MNLTGLVSVSGKPGLYKMLAQNKTGFILETLDEQKTKLVVNLSTSKLATLDDITVYGNDEDLKLKDVLMTIKNYKGTVPEGKADAAVLKKFFTEVAPDYDQEKVYASDMKKILNWFHIIKLLPLFNEEPSAAAPKSTDEVADKKEVKEVKVEKPKVVKPKNNHVAAKSKPAGAIKKTSGKNP
jgi:hypothetical protein